METAGIAGFYRGYIGIIGCLERLVRNSHASVACPAAHHPLSLTGQTGFSGKTKPS